MSRSRCPTPQPPPPPAPDSASLGCRRCPSVTSTCHCDSGARSASLRRLPSKRDSKRGAGAILTLQSLACVRSPMVARAMQTISESHRQHHAGFGLRAADMESMAESARSIGRRQQAVVRGFEAQITGSKGDGRPGRWPPGQRSDASTGAIDQLLDGLKELSLLQWAAAVAHAAGSNAAIDAQMEAAVRSLQGLCLPRLCLPGLCLPGLCLLDFARPTIVLATSRWQCSA